MIKRITNPDEFKQVILDMDEMFDIENGEQGHACDLRHNKDTIIAGFANKQLLNFDVFVWANKEESGFDSLCIFLNERSIKFGKKFFVEFLWISKNPKVGFKLFKEAVKFARKNGFEYIGVSTSERNPNTPKYEEFYDKLGFVQDSSNFIAKL